MPNKKIEEDLKLLEMALALEIEAIKRYKEHHDITKDPEVHSLLEGLQRNEEDHERLLREHIARLIGRGVDQVASRKPRLLGGVKGSYSNDGVFIAGKPRLLGGELHSIKR